MTGQFEGKVALVTGGASGIGAAIAKQLVREGASVVIADRDAAGLDVMAAEIGKAHASVLSYEINVADALEVEAMIGFVEKECGGLHLAVNNAGIGGPSATTADYPLDGWRQVMDVNLNGVFFCTKYEIGAMLRSGGGAIVNVASVNGVVPGFQQGIYSITKAAVISMTKAFAVECAASGVRCNALLPGLTDTKFASVLVNTPAILKQALAHVPMRRVAQPSEMAGAVLYLASDAASYTTGTVLNVDGGYLCV